MKKMKKIISLMLAAVMILAMTTVVFAAKGTNDKSGSITINDAIHEETYSVYQILVLESYNTDAEAYTYKAANGWTEFLTASALVSIDDQGYVTWKGATDDATVAAFAKEALAYAESKNIRPVQSKTAVAGDPATSKVATVEFTGLNLGYYLVDTTLGTLCSLDTTAPNAEIVEKNETTYTEKKVKEDSTQVWGEESTAQIGDIVPFTTTFKAYPGAQNYVLHDKMSKGLTLNKDSIAVTAGGTTLEADNYTVSYGVQHVADGTEEAYTCAFEIKFKQVYLDTINAETDIVVTYTAVLNDEAEIFEIPNTNDTRLTYGDDSHTEWDTTKTKSFKFDIVKTDSDNKLLDGAEFELYTAATGGDKISLVDDGNNVYRVATAEEIAEDNFVSAVIIAKDGQATVIGLDSDAETKYYLEETKAPDGYNKLDGRVEVVMSGGNNIVTTMDGDTWEDGDGGIHITNNKGTELPETGGMGTTILYIGGAVLVLGAVVLLFVRRRYQDQA